MTDYRDRISSSAEFDHPRWWSFERNSRLPYGTFDNGRLSPDFWVLAATVVCLIVALVWGW